MVMLLLRYAPFGIIFLVAGKILEIDDVSKTVAKLGYYMTTVTLGLFLQCFVVL